MSFGFMVFFEMIDIIYDRENLYFVYKRIKSGVYLTLYVSYPTFDTN